MGQSSWDKTLNRRELMGRAAWFDFCNCGPGVGGTHHPAFSFRVRHVAVEYFSTNSPAMGAARSPPAPAYSTYTLTAISGDFRCEGHEDTVVGLVSVLDRARFAAW